MPPFGPIKRGKLIQCLKKSGFSGPFAGGKHQFMVMGELTLHIPNPHKSEIGKELLTRILRQAGISKKEWQKL